MLNKLRNFSKGKLAGVLVGIIIIPFVFWGMGSVFSGGNTNSIAKINNHNVSTQDFADFVNNSKISSEIIKENLDNNIIEQMLTQLISTSLIDIEIKELKFLISDEALAKKIKNQKNFQDENSNFSRTKYEKFLLENKTHSTDFEKGIRDNELKKKLFTYIGGGIKSPYFLVNKNYKEQSKKIEVDFIDLNSIYINKNEISLKDVENHVNENKELFLREQIDISLIKLTPEILTGEVEFTDNYFSKIDEIEELISSNTRINEISQKFSLKLEIVNDYHPDKNNDVLLSEIYKKRNEQTLNILDKNDFFLLYEIKNLKKVLPNLKNDKFIKMVKTDLLEKSKFNINKDLLRKIQEKKFTDNDFFNLSSGKINSLKIKSIKDTNKFNQDSVSLLYSLGINNFSLVSDKNNNVYLVKIKNIYENNLVKSSHENKSYANQTNVKIRNDLYNSYDLLLNEKYKIEVNENTLDRMKNYFR